MSNIRLTDKVTTKRFDPIFKSPVFIVEELKETRGETYAYSKVFQNGSQIQLPVRLLKKAGNKTLRPAK